MEVENPNDTVYVEDGMDELLFDVGHSAEVILSALGGGLLVSKTNKRAFLGSKVVPAGYYFRRPTLEQQSNYNVTLEGLKYKYGSRNGVRPDLFQPREPLFKIMKSLPETHKDFSEDGAIKRVLLFGPPASGKTSIMGKINDLLKLKYNLPIYYVRAAELYERRVEVTKAISSVQDCIILLDDAQEWYEYSHFFALFKSTGRLLVAAATYTVKQFNAATPVEFQSFVESNLAATEVESLLNTMKVLDPSHREDMKRWFGDIYGRYHIVGRNLLNRCGNGSLAETYYQAATMGDIDGRRFLPELSGKIRELVLRVWKGCAKPEERKKLIPYGVLNKWGDWSCDYVSRKYFLDIFQAEHPNWQDLFNMGLPSEKRLAMAGLGSLNWKQLRMSRGSSDGGVFPIEDIWQAEFYGAIGKFIPRSLTFCKEYATSTGGEAGHVDFVLRDGATRAIEFLILSRSVGEHHLRFESGAYSSLCLSAASYLVVDIIHWTGKHDLGDIGPQAPLALAKQKFERLGISSHGDETWRKTHHAVFIASNKLSSGILYTYDESKNEVVRYGESPSSQDFAV